MASVTPMMRAPGNQLGNGGLSYLEFIRMVRKAWADTVPDVPILPAGTGEAATYPCIIYSLRDRQTHSNEPKARYREMLDDENGDPWVIAAQRFVNVIQFAAVTESDPELAEEIIEAFEDFMMTHIPAFKEAGASELLYARRISDTDENRSGTGTVARTVTFVVTLEKIRSVKYERLQSIVVDVRLSNEHTLDPEASLLSPRSYHAMTVFSTSDDLSMIIASGTNFRIGDLIYIAPPLTGSLPDGIVNGYYLISNVVGTPYSDDISYTIARPNFDDPEAYEPVSIDSAGEGRMSYIEDSDIRTRIYDTRSPS